MGEYSEVFFAFGAYVGLPPRIEYGRTAGRRVRFGAKAEDRSRLDVGSSVVVFRHSARGKPQAAAPLDGTYHEHISVQRTVLRSKSAGAGNRRRPEKPRVPTCFRRLESRNFSDLVLMSFRRARMRARDGIGIGGRLVNGHCGSAAAPVAHWLAPVPAKRTKMTRLEAVQPTREIPLHFRCILQRADLSALPVVGFVRAIRSRGRGDHVRAWWRGQIRNAPATTVSLRRRFRLNRRPETRPVTMHEDRERSP